VRVFKRKFAAFLAVTVLAAAALTVCAAQSANNTQKPLFDNSRPLFENEPNFAAGPYAQADTSKLMLKMTLAVLIVVGLGVTAIYVSKKVLPKITNLQGKEIHILETTHLGPRKAMHLVKIGNHRRLLIGSTNDSITTLADLTEAPAKPQSEQIDNI